MFERFSELSVKVVMLAQELSRMRQINIVQEGDLLLAITKVDTEVSEFLTKYGVTSQLIKGRLIRGTEGQGPVELPFSKEARKALEEASHHAIERNVEPIDLMYALCNTSWCLDLLESIGLNVKGLETHFEQVIYKKNNPHLNIGPSSQSASSNEIESKELSRRDYFAAAAMNSLIAKFPMKDWNMIPESSIELADALIKELDKEVPND